MSNFWKFFFVLILPLMIVMIAAPILAITGHQTIAYGLAYPGTGLIVLTVFLYAGYDSRKRWPGKSYMVRLGKILFFER